MTKGPKDDADFLAQKQTRKDRIKKGDNGKGLEKGGKQKKETGRTTENHSSSKPYTPSAPQRIKNQYKATTQPSVDAFIHREIRDKSPTPSERSTTRSIPPPSPTESETDAEIGDHSDPDPTIIFNPGLIFKNTMSSATSNAEASTLAKPNTDVFGTQNKSGDTDPISTPSIPRSKTPTNANEAPPNTPETTTATTTATTTTTRTTTTEVPSTSPMQMETAPKDPATDLQDPHIPTSSTPEGTADGNDLIHSLDAIEAEVADDDEFNSFSIFESIPNFKIKQNRAGETLTAQKSGHPVWKIIKHTDIPADKPELTHQSQNKLDFMPDSLVEQCILAASGKSHKLNQMTKKMLVDKIPRILALVVSSNTLPFETQELWIRHALRANLIQTGSAVDGLTSFMSIQKPGYPWVVVAVSKAAFNTLRQTRALFEPKSRTLVLLRRYESQPDRSQTVTFKGIIKENDRNFKEEEMVTKLFMNQVNEETKARPELKGLTLTRCVHSTTDTETTYATFTFDLSVKPSLIKPWCLPRRYLGPDNRLRTIEPKWLQPCTACLSESHQELGKAKCPWLGFNFGEGRTISTTNAKFLQVGQSEEALKKRKKPDTEINPDVRDVRPAKRNKSAHEEEADDAAMENA